MERQFHSPQMMPSCCLYFFLFFFCFHYGAVYSSEGLQFHQNHMHFLIRPPHPQPTTPTHVFTVKLIWFHCFKLCHPLFTHKRKEKKKVWVFMRVSRLISVFGRYTKRRFSLAFVPTAPPFFSACVLVGRSVVFSSDIQWYSTFAGEGNRLLN